MRCEVCGLDYGLSHSCAGPLSAQGRAILDAGLQPPTNGGLIYYLGEAWKIVRWDDLAIRRNAKDPRATKYAFLVWMASTFVIMLVLTLAQFSRVLTRANPASLVIAIAMAIIVGVAVLAAMTFAQLSLCHLIAKLVFGGAGKFSELMRPLLLGWWVNCFFLIPVVGTLLAAVGWTAVLMMVFEEIEGIERLQAFGISAGINIVTFAVQFWMTPVRHHL